jgi:transposase
MGSSGIFVGDFPNDCGSITFNCMSELTKHYSLLLGLDSAWRVDKVQLETAQKRVVIALEHVGAPLACPECGVACTRYDTGQQRSWRHFDTMQFETQIIARVPRCNCSACGVKTIAVPWAGKHSRFTLMFEAFAIEVLLACGNVKAACELLNLDWDAADAVMKRAVSRGLIRRDMETVTRVGIDENSFGKGHDYVSVMTDIDGRRVLDVVHGRDRDSADALWKALPEGQRGKIKAVAMDMWQAFISATKSHAGQAEIVFDRFHVSKHLNEAVDQIRRKENKALRRQDDDSLTGTKQLWLFNPGNLSREHRQELAELKRLGLNTGRAWAIKEQMRRFWEYKYAGSAQKFFDWWHGWAVRSRLQPIIQTAQMLKRHLDGLLNYIRHGITNAVSEGFNSKIQHLKYNSRGFRNFANYRTRILFYCGKLELQP